MIEKVTDGQEYSKKNLFMRNSSDTAKCCHADVII